MIPLSDRPRIYPRLRRLGEVRLAQGVMPGQTDPATNLLVNGAIVQMEVVNPGGSGGQTYSAMVDTGASITCINIGLARQIGLQQVSSTLLGGVGGQMESPIYAAAIRIPQFEVVLDPVQIAGVQNPLPGVDILIGRDILRYLHMDYSGSGTFKLENETPPPTTANQGIYAPATPGTIAPPGQQVLPQPPGGDGKILGMKPLVAAGVGVAGAGLVVGALFLFDVL